MQPSRNDCTYLYNLYDIKMKIHTGVRDAKRMELAELEAMNRSVIAVQATTSDEREEMPVEVPEEAKKPRKKKKEADV